MNIRMVRQFNLKGKNVIAFSFLVAIALTILLSLKFWIGPRSFPKLGFFDASKPLELGITILFIGSLIAVPFIELGKRRILLAFNLLALISHFTIDLNRLQLYLWMFYIPAFFIYFSKRDSIKENQLWSTIICALGICYFWLGINKLNPIFISKIFPWFISIFNFGHFEIHPMMGILSACTEATGGLLLLNQKSRKAGALILLAMHFIILVCIGPLGHNMNFAVYPWNFALIIFQLFILFDPSFSKLSILETSPVQKIFLLIFFLLPSLNYFSTYPDNFSFLAYSGADLKSKIVPTENDLSKFPNQANSAITNSGDIHMYTWINSETGGALFNSECSNRKIFESICKKFDLSSSTKLVLENRRGIEKEFFCKPSK